VPSKYELWGKAKSMTSHPHLFTLITGNVEHYLSAGGHIRVRLVNGVLVKLLWGNHDQYAIIPMPECPLAFIEVQGKFEKVSFCINRHFCLVAFKARQRRVVDRVFINILILVLKVGSLPEVMFLCLDIGQR
jgi:hypothetical protein